MKTSVLECIKTSMLESLSPTSEEYLLSGDAVHNDVITEICNHINLNADLDIHDLTRILIEAAVARDIDVNRVKCLLPKPGSGQFTDDSVSKVQ